MHLILVRHGNTFGPGDKVVWVGARSDLDLVEKGREQAAAVAAGLKAAGLRPSSIYAGPLKRTRQTAEIISADQGVDADRIVISDDLREIDYGSWEARSNDEIRAEVGDQVIDDWQKRSVWPDGFGWQPGEAGVINGWKSLLVRIRKENEDDAVVLVVSSNGIFRLVAKSLGLSPEEAKMNTGAVAHLVGDGVCFSVKAWNVAPADLSL
ncbi:histidine phosphatase family protein [Pleomorphomonas sp. NRK KF1]|uniref:histidine phosphatase family protein n=1 Tax=Pleomorphomonas sp. NRK KF1 TaxID=2943000 RepID=UPI002043D124|nr:histidine phosphatase family protein [Pleomorphomonas sp. NRK KF1]MCM5553815.1 histidine phosphatase family protein [Pleomorphomonas sp. NRK KF1]